MNTVVNDLINIIMEDSFCLENLNIIIDTLMVEVVIEVFMFSLDKKKRFNTETKCRNLLTSFSNKSQLRKAHIENGSRWNYCIY